MSRVVRAAALAVAVLALVSFAGCQAAPALVAVGGAAVAVGDAYCATVTEAARQGLRDRFTGGRPLVGCVREGR